MVKAVALKYVGMRKTRRVGNSVAITLPAKVIKELNLKVGENMLVFLTDDGRIVLAPEERKELWEE